MGTRPLTRRELEEQKKKEEEEAAAHVFQEFVETFQEAPSKTSKVWVKAGTYDAGARKEDTSERGKLYKPQSKLADAIEKQTSAERAQEYARLLSSKSDGRPPKKRGDKDKKKSNLELFKEELRQIQEEREERHKYKGVLRGAVPDTNEISKFFNDEPSFGSYDNGDPTTTNLYLGNLNPKITEQQLMEIFGRYGPLASIKIMWPRSDEEKARGRNCGFVAYMSRKDGERALRFLNGKEVMNYEMKMGWGKAVCIPPHPIYIPPTMQQPSMPPPQSGLPFNAQPPKHLAHKIPRLRTGEAFPTDLDDKAAFEQILSQSIVKVVIPTERNILMLIHRMVEFVIREGPMFEAMIMNKEINNPIFRFLFENQSPPHIYYRWKLYSLLQGDVQKQWTMKDFRMFKGGSVWRPPVMNVYTQGMPDELVEEEVINSKGSLSKTQRERLEDLIRQLTPERQKIADAMVFCIEHADAAEEIADCISESLSMITTAIHKKIARIYLIADILHNCGTRKLSNATFFRKAFQQRLEQIFKDARLSWENLDSRLQAEGFGTRVRRVLGVWDDWNVYPKDFLTRIKNVFNGVENKEASPGAEAAETAEGGSGGEEGSGGGAGGGDTGSGGSSSEGEAEGGLPLDGAALRRLAAASAPRLLPPAPPAPAPSLLVLPPSVARAVALHEDIDGVPLAEEDIDGVPLAEEEGGGGGGFIPSRWERVDPAQVEAQAVTTSQWQALGGARGGSAGGDAAGGDTPPAPSPPPYLSRPSPSPPDNGDSGDLTAERRALLRNVELKALSYQDEIEAGRKPLKAGWTLQQQVQHYRKKLIKKAEREAKEKEAEPESPDSRASERRSHREKERGREKEKEREREREKEREKEREREREGRGRSGSSEEGYRPAKKWKRRSASASASPPAKKARRRSRSGSRGRRRRAPTPPTPPPASRSQSPGARSAPRSLERVRHRREPSPPPASARKHRHKHKY